MAGGGMGKGTSPHHGVCAYQARAQSNINHSLQTEVKFIWSCNYSNSVQRVYFNGAHYVVSQK
jgi:hypothetical protein